MITPPRVDWSVRDASTADVDVVARTMALSFRDDPVMRWTFPARRGRDRKIAAYFQMMTSQLFVPGGRVLMTHDGSGAAFWVQPGALPLVPLDREAFVLESRRLFGARIEILEHGGRLVEEYHPIEPHYYLAGLGVHPARRGRGIGTSLIAPILARSDAEAVGAYVEASSLRNVALYERLGFRVRREVDLPGGPSLFLMWRAPH